jgi:large subunit ribosomal protein L4
MTTKKASAEKASTPLNPAIFDCSYNESLIHQAVVATQNSMRSGNAAQKTRAEVRGGGKKPWNQKGTGRARAGTIRSPLWRSGGVVFAAKKRDYTQKLNKKMYRGAIRSILSELHRTERLVVVPEFKCAQPKTKEFLAKMHELNIKNALIVMDELGENEYLAARNVFNYWVCDVEEIDPVALLRFEQVVITEAAIKLLEERLQ